VLNGRVRNGIGCFHFARSTGDAGLKRNVEKCKDDERSANEHSSLPTEKMKVVRNRISIARLSPSQGVHLQPINLVIFQDFLTNKS
jgi:hypothetical protein